MNSESLAEKGLGRRTVRIADGAEARDGWYVE